MLPPYIRSFKIKYEDSASTIKEPAGSSGAKNVWSGSHKISVFLAREAVAMATPRHHLSTAFRILTIRKGTMKEFQLGKTFIYVKKTPKQPPPPFFPPRKENLLRLYQAMSH